MTTRRVPGARVVPPPLTGLLSGLLTGLLTGLLALAATGCAASDGPRPPARRVVTETNRVLLAVVARDVLRLPGVRCVTARVGDDGVPLGAATTFGLEVQTAGTSRAERDALALETGRRLWRSGAYVLRASVRVSGAPGDAVSDLHAVLVPGGDERPATSVELFDRFGPRASAPPSLPPYPGPPPACPPAPTASATAGPTASTGPS